MKPVKAYAVITGFKTLSVTDERLPIFWYKGVAQDYAEETNGTVITVIINQHERGKHAASI